MMRARRQGGAAVSGVLDRLQGLAKTTTRSMAAEFGPTWASRYPELAQRSDQELITRPLAEIITEIEAERAANAAQAARQAAARTRQKVQVAA